MGYKYLDNENNKLSRKVLGDWIKNYSINNYGSEWNYCLGLSYRYNVKNLKWRNNVKGLIKNLYIKDNNLNGFIFNEYDLNFQNIHHHLIIKSDLIKDEITKIVNKNWNKKGLFDLMIYDKDLFYCNYITKHYNKYEENEFNLILDLI
jgi:hypothetical protein